MLILVNWLGGVNSGSIGIIGSILPAGILYILARAVTLFLGESTPQLRILELTVEA